MCIRDSQVAQLVEGVTKITRIEVESLTDEQAATIRKMFVAMSKDIRVIVIKLADRLHNMRTCLLYTSAPMRSSRMPCTAGATRCCGWR